MTQKKKKKEKKKKKKEKKKKKTKTVILPSCFCNIINCGHIENFKLNKT